MTMRETTTGNGGLDRMRGGGRDGRGNLRENREDPAPTVGIAIQIAPKCRRLHARTMPPRMPPTYGTLWFLQRRGMPHRDPVFAPPTYGDPMVFTNAAEPT